jgi:hypothetical protein
MHVGPTDVVLSHVRQLRLDRIRIPLLISLSKVEAVARNPDFDAALWSGKRGG